VRTRQARRFVSYELTVHPQHGYLQIIVTGENSRQTVTRYMEEVVRECTLRLVEERLADPRLGTLDDSTRPRP
jgi:hypothetical protein